MKDLLNQIQTLLKENNQSPEETSASKSVESHSDTLKKEISKGDLHASKKKSNKEDQDNKSEEDLNSLSKKDLEKEEPEESKEPEDERVETPDESPSTINLAEALNLENHIDCFNQFRGSPSLKNKKVYSGLSDYFNKLTADEKKVLYVFIKGLIQITMLNVPGKTAYAPSDLMFNIKKTGVVSSEKKKSMKNKIDAKKSSGDTPIKIGESKQNKRELLNIVKNNK